MKTAKKLLCLALVLVMALGLVPFASAKNAADYTDIASVTDPDALEALYVMSAIGVTEGYPEGHFGPNTTFTRAEATAIISRMLLGDKAASLPASGTIFTDVPADFWGSGYISFCTAQGILAGYGDGTFGPQDTLTAAAFTVMLLRAIGIGDIKSYVGESWYMDAYAEAIKEKSKIFTLDVDFLADATREDVVIYAFNALQVQTGEPVEKYQILPGNGYVPEIGGTGADGLDAILQATVPVFYDTPLIARQAGINAGGTFGVHFIVQSIEIYETGSLAEAVFDLRLDDETDDLGRPNEKVWYRYPTIPSRKTAIYAIPGDDPVATFDKDFTQADLYAVTGLGGVAELPAAEIKGQLNSKNAATNTSLYSHRVSNVPGRDSASTTNVLGYGVRTEIFQTGPRAYKAVVIKPSFGKLTITPVAATATVGARDRYTIGPITASDNYIVYTSHVAPAFEYDNVIIDGDVKNGDMVLYYRGDDFLYIEAVETITGVLSTLSAQNVFTIDGKTHNMADACDPAKKGAPSKDAQTFYVDSFNNILEAKVTVTPPLKVALLISTEVQNVLVGTQVIPTPMATIVDINGEVQVVELPATTSISGTPLVVDMPLIDPEGGGPIALGAIVTWSIAEGKYVFTKATVVGGEPTDLEKIGTNGSDITAITRGTAALTGAGSGVLYANNATKFVVVQYTGGTPNGKVTVYTGISNVPSYAALNPGDATAVSKLMVGASSNPVADIVYIYGNPAAAGDKGTPYVYYTGSYVVTVNDFLVDLIISGELVQMNVRQEVIDEFLRLNTLNYPLLYAEIEITSDGKLVVDTLATPPIPTRSNAITYGIPASPACGVVNVNGALMGIDTDGDAHYIGAVASDVPVYTFFGATVITSTAADLDVELEAYNQLHVDKTTDGVVHAIYIL